MIIVAGGDSFIWGSELQDCRHSGPRGYSKSTFTALISHDYEYDCVAGPGLGNDSIARRLITYCEQNKNKSVFVVASWTFPNRYEFYLNNSWATINLWTVERQYNAEGDKHLNKLVEEYETRAKNAGVHEFATSYFKHVGFVEYWETYISLKEITYLQNYLKANNIPYMFTSADCNFLNTHTIKYADEVIQGLYNQIDFDKWFFFPDHKGFYTWALDNKYKVGVTHPLEDAHRDAALLIKEKFNELVTKHH